MAKERRVRSIEELYNVTEIVSKPKITPVLRGSFRMQGPFDEAIDDIPKNMVESGSGKKFGMHSVNQKVHMKVESGTCNVCAAPCSSCMHLKRLFMGSKTEEFSDENCRTNPASQCLTHEGDSLSSVRSKACDGSLLHSASETSNLLSASSGQDSISENADSKSKLRSSEISEGSEDVEKFPGRRTVVVDATSLKPAKQIFSNEHENSKFVEDNDDIISCVSGSSDANTAVGQHNLGKRNLHCTSASVNRLDLGRSGRQVFTCKSEEAPLMRYVDSGNSSLKSQNQNSYQQNGTNIPVIASVVGLEQDTSSHEEGKQPGCSVEKNSLKKEIMSDEVGGNGAGDSNCPLETGRSMISKENNTNKDSKEPSNGTWKFLEPDYQDEKCSKMAKSDDMQKVPSQLVSGEETDESDIVEHDVKVCDICGDAGREDLLATCSRCSDGAEHTYCMKEKLLKVPEGDWLCEECKFAEETEKKKQDPDGIRVKDECPSRQISAKRMAENLDIGPPAKRQASETSSRSPRLSSPSSNPALSRHSSFKNIDKGKIKPAHQISFSNQSNDSASEPARSTSIASRHQMSNRTLSKSNSFSTINSRPKVKLVDEFVPLKQRGTRGNSSLDIKEGPVRTLGKTSSLKSPNSGRRGNNESKIKMLPSQFSSVQDARALKPMKEQDASERRSQFKLDRSRSSSGMNSSISKSDKRSLQRGNSVSFPSVSSIRELKAGQSDCALPKSPIPRRSDVRGSSAGASSTNDICSSSVEQKLNKIDSKDEHLSSSSTAERPSHNIDGTLQDKLLQPVETTDQDEKSGKVAATELRPAITSGSKVNPCQKCGEISHATELCSAGNLQISGMDVCAVRSSREEMHKGDKLKDAIQAASHKMPVIYRKKRGLLQTDEISLPSTEMSSEISSQDQLPVTSKLKNVMSSDVTHAVQETKGSVTSASHKHVNLTQARLLHGPSALTPLKLGNSSECVISPVEKPMVGDLGFPVPMSFLFKMSAIPEHEYAWQGGFKVHRGGKPPDFCDGIQAHLSTCASPKVLDVTNKFPSNFPLNEVPRLSIWPAQFRESGAREDNVALYFFARDIESYERNYKGLLDGMIRNDLALEGKVDGVELLIFPSSQLPEKAQRWNMLYFLWGVFRERRAKSSEPMKMLNAPRSNVAPLEKDSNDAVSASNDRLCLPKCIDKENFACDKSSHSEDSNAPDKTCNLKACGPNNGEPSFVRVELGSQSNSIWEDKFDSKSPSTVMKSSSSQVYQDSGSAVTQGELGPSRGRSADEHKRSQDVNFTDKCEQTEASSRECNSPLKILPAMKSFGTAFEEKGIEKKASEKVKVEEEQTDLNICVPPEAALQRDISTEEVDWSQKSNHHRKRLLLDLSEMAHSTPTDEYQQLPPWNEAKSKLVDGEDNCKRQNVVFSDVSEYSGRPRGRNIASDGFSSRMNDNGPCSSIQEKRCDDACAEKIIPEDLRTTERYLFPIGSQAEEKLQLGVNTVSLKPLSSAEDQFHDGSPNLELGLGAKTKPAGKGMIPFFVGLVDKKNTPSEKPPIDVVDEVEDDVAASLSLSLAFPSADKKQAAKPMLKTEQLLPERRHVSTSLFLFGDLSEK